MQFVLNLSICIDSNENHIFHLFFILGSLWIATELEMPYLILELFYLLWKQSLVDLDFDKSNI